MDNILVTGSTGFVGGNLLPYLEGERFNLMGVSRRGETDALISYKRLNSEIWNDSELSFGNDC